MDENEAWRNLPAAFAQENALPLDSLEERRSIRAKVGEEEVTGARVGLDTNPAEFRIEPLTQAIYFLYVAPHGRGIAHGSLGSHQGGNVDGEGRHPPTQEIEGILAREDSAKAESSKPRNFRERANHEQLRVAANPRSQSDAGKFGVGFVDDYGGVGWRLENWLDGFSLQKSPGWGVWSCDGEDT